MFVRVFVISLTPKRTPWPPARWWFVALRLALRKGVSASPLRSNPETPFLTHHNTNVQGGARCRVSVGSERAARV